ncbi:MAG: hypothetical protein AB2651_18785 [Candidatus Thiodiazotropha sp.]
MSNTFLVRGEDGNLYLIPKDQAGAYQVDSKKSSELEEVYRTHKRIEPELAQKLGLAKDDSDTVVTGD